jgi:hypothetical protein
MRSGHAIGPCDRAMRSGQAIGPSDRAKRSGQASSRPHRGAPHRARAGRRPQGHAEEGLTAAASRSAHASSPVTGPESVRRRRAIQRRQPVAADVDQSSAPPAAARRDSAHARSTSGSQDHSARNRFPYDGPVQLRDRRETAGRCASGCRFTPSDDAGPAGRRSVRNPATTARRDRVGDPLYWRATQTIPTGRYGRCRAAVR